jgi:hypothetical protein
MILCINTKIRKRGDVKNGMGLERKRTDPMAGKKAIQLLTTVAKTRLALRRLR